MIEMRIAYLIPEFPGQTHAFFWRERDCVQARGHEVRLFSTRPPGQDSVARHDWADQAVRQTRYLAPIRLSDAVSSLVELMGSGPTRLGRAIRAAIGLEGASARSRVRALAMLVPAAQLRRRSRLEQIQHIHVHSAASGALVAMLCRLLGGPPYSITLHGAIPTYGPGQRAKWTHAAFGITVNEQLRQELLEIIPDIEDRVSVAPMGVDIDRFSRTQPYSPPAEGEPWRLVTCGRLHPGKGHADLIRAVALLRDQGQATTLTILGEGPDRTNLQALIDELGLAQSVTMPGSVSEAQVRDQLEQSHLFALASHNEALGVATMEAMAMHLPVVVTNVGGVGELVRDGIDGVMVGPMNPQAIANAVADLAGNPQRCIALGEAAGQRIRESFDSTISAELLVRLIQETPPHLHRAATANVG